VSWDRHSPWDFTCIVIFLQDIFFCGPFLKSFWSLLEHYFCFFIFWFFGCRSCGILAPWPGIKPVPHVLGGEVLDPQGSPDVTVLPCHSLAFCSLKIWDFFFSYGTGCGVSGNWEIVIYWVFRMFFWRNFP